MKTPNKIKDLIQKYIKKLEKKLEYNQNYQEMKAKQEQNEALYQQAKAEYDLKQNTLPGPTPLTEAERLAIKAAYGSCIIGINGPNAGTKDGVLYVKPATEWTLK